MGGGGADQPVEETIDGLDGGLKLLRGVRSEVAQPSCDLQLSVELAERATSRGIEATLYPFEQDEQLGLKGGQLPAEFRPDRAPAPVTRIRFP